jgi:hypothetical protein
MPAEQPIQNGGRKVHLMADVREGHIVSKSLSR